VDYYNVLLTGLSKMSKRQVVAAHTVRVLSRTRKYEHITPVLRSLHWLPVTFRIDFKKYWYINHSMA